MITENDIAKYISNNLRETPILARNYITVNNHKLPKRNPYIQIVQYVDDFFLERKQGKIERWLVLPGLRGTGKTTLILQIYDHMVNGLGIKKENILYLSANDVKNYLGIGIRDVIIQYIKDIHRTTLVELKEKIFIIIDEAHFDPTWDETIKALYDRTVGKDNLFIIVTGSSSIALEMSTDSARRKIKSSIFPINFQEYLTLKYEFFPPRGTSNLIRDAVFNGNDDGFQKHVENENTLYKKFLDLPRSVDIELEDFIYQGGFPFAINMQPVLIYEKIADLIEKIICDDLSLVYNYNVGSRSDITKMLIFLALKQTGDVSQSKLSSALRIPLARVNQTLDALEQTHLIFSVKPYEGAAGTVRDAWRYYFLSSTLKSTLLYKNGRLDRTDRIRYGELVEHAVVSSFFRMMKTINKPTGIFFDPGKGGADILLTYGDKLIPVEICAGKKNYEQVDNTARRYKKINHKIVISNEEKTKCEDDTICIPLKTFLFS